MIQDLIGKEVEVNAVDIIYRGILTNINDTEISLSTESGWITIPTGQVVDVKAVEK